MDRERLQEIAATVPAVQTVLDMTAYEPLSDGEKARLSFQVLAQQRADLSKRLRQRGQWQPLIPVVWPREAEEQAQVLRFLAGDCGRLAVVLSRAEPVQAVA